MKALNAIAGVPRSGSTLLCNILNQNPAFHATDTSAIPEIMGTLTSTISINAEIQGLLAVDSEKTEQRIREAMRALVSSWYSEMDKVVFDKSRGWAFHGVLLADLFPEAKIIATVRDLRNVFGSIEKQHRKAPFFDMATNPMDKTIMQRADVMMSPTGMIGTCVVGLQDLISRCPKRVHVVRFESLAHDPKTNLSEIYEFLELEPYEHDFDNIENVSNEPDHLYLNKFPHNGDGKVEKTDRNAWQEYLTPDLAQMIHSRYPDYNKLFGY